MQILSGDIGGTSTRLALIEVDRDSLDLLHYASYRSLSYPGLHEIITEFTQQHALHLDAACFGVAGPVLEQRCITTNLPWHIDAHEIRSILNLREVSLINDLEAIAWGIPALKAEQIHTLHQGTGDGTGNRLVIAAGTGLGQAGIYWDGNIFHPFASEGGHADFAPADDLEFQLLLYLQNKFGHVSWERVVSGQGLANIYDFLIDHHKSVTPAWLEEAFLKGDKSAAISKSAMNNADEICVKSLELFIKLFAAEAGNHALKMMAKGGIYLAGGIPPKILDWLKKPLFMSSFLDKGRMTDLVASMPVRVILDDRCGLYGPALYQAKRISDQRPI